MSKKSQKQQAQLDGISGPAAVEGQNFADLANEAIAQVASERAKNDVLIKQLFHNLEVLQNERNNDQVKLADALQELKKMNRLNAEDIKDVKHQCEVEVQYLGSALNDLREQVASLKGGSARRTAAQPMEVTAVAAVDPSNFETPRELAAASKVAPVQAQAHFHRGP